MAVSTDVSATGLYLTANPLDAPAGALKLGNNAVLRRPGIAEARRGQAPHVSFSGKALSFGTFEGALVAHTDTDKVEYRKTQSASFTRAGATVTVTAVAHGLSAAQVVALVDTSNATTFPEGRKTIISTPTADTFTYTEAGTATSGTGTIASVVAYSGTYTAPDGAPMRFFEAGGALYFTTDEGLYRVDELTGEPVLAGIPPGLEGSAATVASDGGWLAYGETAGYRLVWARRDGDGDLLLGAPSGRILVTNSAVAISNMTRAVGVVTATVPSGHGLETNDVIEILTSSNTGVVSLGNKTLASGGVGTTITWAVPTVAISDMDRAAGVVTATVPTGHGLIAGNLIEIVTSSDTGVIALGTKTLTSTGASTFTWTEVGGADGTNKTGTYAVGATGTGVTGTYAGIPVSVNITTPIPAEIIAGTHFLLGFRTVRVAEDGEPGEDMAASVEYFPTPADVAAGTLTVEDFAPFASGASAYFSPSEAQGGLLAAKLQPPTLGDAVVFRGYTIATVKECRQTLGISLLGVTSGGGDALGISDGLSFSDGTTTETYTSAAAEAFPNEFLLFLDGTPASNIENTTRSLVRAINSRDGGLIYATYASGPNDPPGRFVVTSRVLGGAVVTVSALLNGDAWVPKMRRTLGVNASRTANVVTLSFSGNDHKFTVGDTLEVLNVYGVPADAALFPPGVKTVASVPTIDTLTYAEVGADGSSAGSMSVSSLTSAVTLTQEARASSWGISDLEEYDAWPPKYRYQVGGAQSTLYRTVQQNDAVLFYTDDGFYRLTGNDPTDFNLQPIDSTARLVAPKSVVALSNRNLALTDQGVVLIENINVRIVSGSINEELRKFYAGTKALKDAIFADAYAFANETEQEYWLGLPDEADPTGGVTQFYVLNLGTGGWTRVPYEAAAAYVLPGEGRIYMQPAEASPITRERRNRNATDQQDADGVGIPFEVEYQTKTAKHPGAVKQWVHANVLLEKPQPATIQLRFGSELDDVMYGLASVPTQSNGNVRTGVPRDASRSRTLKVRVNHSTAGEKIAILGLAIDANVMGLKAGK